MKYPNNLTMNYDRFVEDIRNDHSYLTETEIARAIDSGFKITLLVYHHNRNHPDIMKTITTWDDYVLWRDQVRLTR